MIRRHRESKRTYRRFPYTTLFLSDAAVDALAPVHEAIAALSTKVTDTRGDLAQAPDALRGIAEGLLRLDSRTDARLTEVRDSAASSLSDLDGKLAPPSTPTDRRVGEPAPARPSERALNPHTAHAAPRRAPARVAE